jgi:hypothetical protein
MFYTQQSCSLQMMAGRSHQGVDCGLIWCAPIGLWWELLIHHKRECMLSSCKGSSAGGRIDRLMIITRPGFSASIRICGEGWMQLLWLSLNVVPLGGHH